MKLKELLEQYNTSDLDHDVEHDKLVPMARTSSRHRVDIGDILQKAGFKIDKQSTKHLDDKQHNIYSGTTHYKKGDQEFFVTPDDNMIDDDFHPSHLLHNTAFLHLVDTMGLLKKEHHPHKSVTWVDFDPHALKSAGIRTF